MHLLHFACFYYNTEMKEPWNFVETLLFHTIQYIFKNKKKTNKPASKIVFSVFGVLLKNKFAKLHFAKNIIINRNKKAASPIYFFLNQ